MENNEQFNENNDNYLILNQQNIDEDLPLFSDIISSKYNKNYRVPFYEHDEEEKNWIICLHRLARKKVGISITILR